MTLFCYNLNLTPFFIMKLHYFIIRKYEAFSMKFPIEDSSQNSYFPHSYTIFTSTYQFKQLSETMHVL